MSDTPYHPDGLLKPDVIAELERLSRIATRGSWKVESWGGDAHIVSDAHVGAIADIRNRLDLPPSDPIVAVEMEANAALIAQALTCLPGLLLAARMVEVINRTWDGQDKRGERVKKAKAAMPTDLFAEPETVEAAS